VDELYFRGKDRIRSNKPLVVPATVVVLATVGAGVSGGFAAAAGVFVLCAAAIVPALLVSRRCWTRVGRDGITTFRGGSRGRTWTLDRITWIEIRASRAKVFRTYTVHLTLTDGRARSLPGLGTSTVNPDPEFPGKVDQVISCWELHTDPPSRVPPATDRSVGRRARGILLMILTAGCLAGTVTLAALLPSAYAAQRAQRTLPICAGEQLTHVGVQNCSMPWDMTVQKVSFSKTRDDYAFVDIRYINTYTWEVEFDSDLSVVRALRPGEHVTATTAADGITVTDLRVGGRVAHTVDSPEYTPATYTTGLVTCASGTVLGLGWLLLRRRPPYHLVSWWGPCCLPAMITLVVFDIEKTGPLSTGGFVLAGVLLVAGLLLAALIHSARRARFVSLRRLSSSGPR
jgi:hypothetical protein